jgi:hypothetical protein
LAVLVGAGQLLRQLLVDLEESALKDTAAVVAVAQVPPQHKVHLVVVLAALGLVALQRQIPVVAVVALAVHQTLAELVPLDIVFSAGTNKEPSCDTQSSKMK